MNDVQKALVAAKQLIEGKKEDMMFDVYAPLYPFNTENSARLFFERNNLINENNVATITGSGDAPLDLIANGVKKIHAFDINGLAKYHAKLKIAAVKAMTFEEFKQFFLCNYDGYVVNEHYQKARTFLDDETRLLWDEIFKFINEKKLKMHPWFEGTDAKLFYKIQSLMGGQANRTIKNPFSYMANETTYNDLKQILLNKNSEYITFHDTDVFDVDKVIDFNGINYFYFSNVMDFFVCDDNYIVHKEELISFKHKIKSLLDKIPLDSFVDVCILKEELFQSDLENYEEVYSLAEGFSLEKLGEKLVVLSFSKKRKVSLTQNPVNLNFN